MPRDALAAKVRELLLDHDVRIIDGGATLYHKHEWPDLVIALSERAMKALTYGKVVSFGEPRGFPWSRESATRWCLDHDLTVEPQ